MQMKNKIFVTGANGFVGSYLCKKFDEMGADFLGLVQPGSKDKLCKTTVEGDLLDKEGLTRIIEEYKPEAVLHLAAIANPTFGNVAQIYDVNVKGSENLLEVVRNCGLTNTRVVLVSTAGVYGD